MINYLLHSSTEIEKWKKKNREWKREVDNLERIFKSSRKISRTLSTTLKVDSLSKKDKSLML